MSVVGVVVIDCTEIGASPPTATLPTMIWRVLRLGASTGGGPFGRPRFTAGTMLLALFICLKHKHYFETA